MSRSPSRAPVARDADAVRPVFHARHLSAVLDDGRALFSDVELRLVPGPVALVGANGSGKSTLLRMIVEAASPRGGMCLASPARICHVPQHVDIVPPRVVDLLGAGARVDALRRLLAGEGDAEDAGLLGDDWALEATLRGALDALGLEAIGLDADPSRLSGGQCQQLRLLAAQRSGADLLLLDEPSTFLDADASLRWRDRLLSHPAAVLVVTHDPVWLQAVDAIVELREGRLHRTGGGLEAWRAAQSTRRAMEAAALAQTQTERARVRRAATAARTRLARDAARGRRDAREANQSPLLLDHRADRADRSRSRAEAGIDARLVAADAAVRVAHEAMEDAGAPEFIDPSACALPAARQVLSFVAAHPCAPAPGAPLDWVCSGPVRIALTGANGSGKSTLLRAIAGKCGLAHGTVTAHVPVQSLDQHLAQLPPHVPALDWLQARVQIPEASEVATRLALLGLRGGRARVPLGALSGGERMRVAVGAAVWARPAAPLLLLDEPASHLDFDSVDALVAMLRAWPGALVVVSHDPGVHAALDATHRLHLDAGGLVLA